LGNPGGRSLAGITAGPDGNLWFTESPGNRIGRITPAGVVTEFSTGITSYPSRITAGPDNNLWFTGSNSIGRITPAGVVTEFSTGITAGSYPTGITVGPDNNLWFTEWGDNVDRIGRVSGVCSNGPFKIGSTIYNNYPTVQAMYEAMGDATLQIQAQVFGGNLLLDQTKTIKLQGGYDCGFTTNPGVTIIKDKMTIQHGKVTIDKITIK
jgi:streptogramin lyase